AGSSPAAAPSRRRSSRSRAPPAEAGAGASAPPLADLLEGDLERAPHLHRVLAGRRDLRRPRGGAERVHVGELPLRVVAVPGLSHRRAEDRAVTERAARHLPAQLRMLLVA